MPLHTIGKYKTNAISNGDNVDRVKMWNDNWFDIGQLDKIKNAN